MRNSTNIFVSIDESLFRHKPKYHRGRAPKPDSWVFGMVDLSTKPGKGLMWLVPDRKASTLIPLIMDNVIDGTIIHSDQWSAYRQLSTKTNITYKTIVNIL